ncbi:hypothetical protein [Pseudooceanicola sp. HF7]|uniref:hypothetical protein n=1 Tax=Pseudooceanicola sp. HF7 TaxID=2721560 RepID=UPI001C37C08F|nr:hypothetical protein [Pseudooceanicola sp. HF7]
MKDISNRVIHTERCLSLWEEDNSRSLRLEEAALQVRMICEATLLASFSLHSKVVDDLLSTLKKNDGWDKLRKVLEKENPNYMPSPISSVRTPTGVIQIAHIEDKFISGSELFKMWGKASELLHCRNPLKTEFSAQEKADEISAAIRRFKDVLHQHAIFIPCDGTLYMVNVVFSTGEPEVLWWTASQESGSANQSIID